MKTLLLVILIFIFNESMLAQNLWQIKTDSANFAVLISDYETYEFEKGYFSVHEPNTNTENKLPIESIYNPPIDFGDITFLYSVNKDTLFSGEIIWQGVGDIVFPRNFIPADSFSIGQTIISEPISYVYFTNYSGFDYSLFKTKADSAWDRIKNLDIVNAFSQHQYRIGIYLYTPGTGVPVDSTFNDFVEAKWVIFLYTNNPGTSAIKDNEIIPHEFNFSQNYANPFNPSTIINYTLADAGRTKIIVYDLLGREVETLVNQFQLAGNYKVEFDGSNLSSGIYFYTLTTGSFKQTKKMLLIK